MRDNILFDPIPSDYNRILTFDDIQRGQKIYQKALDFYSLIDHVWGSAEEILNDAESIASDFDNNWMKRETEEQKTKVKKMMQYLESYNELEFQGIVSMCTSARIHIVEITAYGFLNSKRALAITKDTLDSYYHQITRWTDFDTIFNEMHPDFSMPENIEECNRLAGKMVAKRIMKNSPLICMERSEAHIAPYLRVVAVLVK